MTHATETTRTASPTKLRDGSWGAVAKGAAAKGDTIRIETRAGKSWTAVVSAVVWTGPGRTGGIVTIVRTAESAARSAPRRSYSADYCGYPCPVSGRRCCAANGPCHDCA